MNSTKENYTFKGVQLSERGTRAPVLQEQSKIEFLQTAPNLNKPVRAFQDCCTAKLSKGMEVIKGNVKRYEGTKVQITGFLHGIQ